MVLGVWEGSTRWPRACRVASAGPALLLGLPGVRRALAGPRCVVGDVSADLEPGGSRHYAQLLARPTRREGERCLEHLCHF